MSLSSEVFTLVGVILGASTSFAATYLVERFSWRRNQTVRWDERRLAAYVDYSNSVKNIVTLATRLASNEILDSGVGPLERTPENFERLTHAEVRRTNASDTLRLFGDVDTMTAAREMTKYAWRLAWLARGLATSDDSDWRRAHKEYEDARDEYIACARRHLQITGTHIARTPRLHSLEWPIAGGLGSAEIGSEAGAPATTQRVETGL